MPLNHNSMSLVTWSVVCHQRIDIFAFISSDTYFCMCHFASYVLVYKTTEIMPRFKLYVALNNNHHYEYTTESIVDLFYRMAD